MNKNCMDFKYSIIATTYNDEYIICDYLKDIISQSLKPEEIVIADGGSNDNTIMLIRQMQYKTDIPIVILSGQRLNIAEGYNHAIISSKCEFLGITGVGNRYEKEFFEKLYRQFENKDGMYSPIRGHNSTFFSRIYNSAFLHGKIGSRMNIPSNHGVLIKKSVFEDLGLFYEKFVYAGEDTEFYTYAKNHGYVFGIVENAYVEWDTPRNINEYKKQIRVYTIAGMQIDPIKARLDCNHNVLKLVVIFLVLFFLGVSIVGLLKGNLVFLLFILFLLAGVTIKWSAFRPIKIINAILQVFYFACNTEYLKEEYRVQRFFANRNQ